MPSKKHMIDVFIRTIPGPRVCTGNRSQRTDNISLDHTQVRNPNPPRLCVGFYRDPRAISCVRLNHVISTSTFNLLKTYNLGQVSVCQNGMRHAGM